MTHICPCTGIYIGKRKKENAVGKIGRRKLDTMLVCVFLSLTVMLTGYARVHAESTAAVADGNTGEAADAAQDTTDAAENTAVQTKAPCAVLMEASTGKILYAKGAETERTPASVTKLMTLLLIYEELESGRLALSDMVTVSAHAQSMGGSQVFLEEGEQQTVETLIKCIVIASGNDASVAMAEHIAGSEPAFVERMNQRAAELSLEHTHFVDCCGLTDDAAHYMSAGDIAVVSRELILRFPELFGYSTVWMEDITHHTRRGDSTFTLTNTNKLLRSYDGCIGLKTGSTSRAGYCVSEVAKRDDLTMIAVILGGETSKERFADAASLLTYGFGLCHLYTDSAQTVECPQIAGAKRGSYRARMPQDFTWLDTKKSDISAVEKTYHFSEELTAPLQKGDSVGKVIYTLQGQQIGQMELVLTEDVEKKTWQDCLRELYDKLLHKEQPQTSGAEA